ncbi:hypothetical protein [Nocardiopsis flavescens]
MRPLGSDTAGYRKLRTGSARASKKRVAQEAGVLAALLGFGPPPRGADWDASAQGLAEAGLATGTAEDGVAVDPDVRFSLVPEHSPSAGEEAEGEH